MNCKWCSYGVFFWWQNEEIIPCREIAHFEEVEKYNYGWNYCRSDYEVKPDEFLKGAYLFGKIAFYLAGHAFHFIQ